MAGAAANNVKGSLVLFQAVLFFALANGFLNRVIAGKVATPAREANGANQ